MTGFKLVAESALRGLPVLLLTALVASLYQRGSAAQRFLLWFGAIASQLLILVFVAIGPEIHVDLFDASPSFHPPATSVSKIGGTAAVTQMSSPAANVASQQSAREYRLPLMKTESLVVIFAVTWAVGALLIFARFLAGSLQLALLSRRSQIDGDQGLWKLVHEITLRIGIRRPVRVLAGDAFQVPVTWGFVYPLILLPRDSSLWTHDRRRLVLLHEIAHVKRLDVLTETVAQICLAVFWINPLVWIAVRAMRVEREMACDDFVLSQGAAPSAYADNLVEILRSYTEPHYPAIAGFAMASSRKFVARVHAILAERTNRQATSLGYRVLVVGGLALLSVPVAELQPFGSPASSGGTPSFRWNDVMPPGTTFRLRSFNGPIIIDEARGKVVNVTAEPVLDSTMQLGVEPLPMRVVRDGRSVSICAMASIEDECTSEGHTPRRLSEAPVTRMLIRASVPAGVNVVVGTGNGALAVRASANVTAQSGNGPISVSTRDGSISAATGNGAIEATMVAVHHPIPMEFRSGNGNVKLTVPRGLNAEIRATLRSGVVIADDRAIQGGPASTRHGRDYHLRLGRGGVSIKVSTSLGNLNISQLR